MSESGPQGPQGAAAIMPRMKRPSPGVIVAYMFVCAFAAVFVFLGFGLYQNERQREAMLTRLLELPETTETVEVRVGQRLFSLHKVTIEGRRYYASISYRGDLLLTPAE